MATNILNHPDLNQEQLRDFARQLNRNLMRLYDAHSIVIEDVFDEFKDSISAISRHKIFTIVNHLDDAIATSVRLRKSLFEDLKYHIERGKPQKREVSEDKGQEAEQQAPKS